jgi:hypothetical protein
VLLNGDIMLSIQAIGDDGVTDRSAAAIDVFASNTPAAGHVPGTFRVRTANTSGALVAGLTIDDTQKATLSGPVTLSGLGATPGGKQPVCIDTATGVLYKANAGAC